MSPLRLLLRGLRALIRPDRADAASPVFGFDIELFTPGTRERVVPRSARARGLTPFRVEQARALETLERGEE